MDTNPADILKDPDFQGLNLVEKGKVLARIDLDYAGLPPMHSTRPSPQRKQRSKGEVWKDKN